MKIIAWDCCGRMRKPICWTATTGTNWRNRFFRSSAKNQLFGPGHNSFTRSEDGEHDVLIYHARPKIVTEGDPLDVPDRHAHAQVFSWSDNGFPIFGEPGTDND